MSFDLRRIAEALPGYDIGGELGRGSWGVVLGAKHRQLQRDVAIKQLAPEYAADEQVRARFVAEALLLSAFDHPHVVRVLDFFELDGLCLLVLERLPRGTLTERCRMRRPTPEAACAMILCVCSGLQYAHERGVLHRDIKPGNLMFSTGDVLKLTDFGIAKVLGGSAAVRTRTGRILGTPDYMAPEQAQGRELTPATDVYGCATVLYEMLSGTLPFDVQASPLAMMHARVTEDPKPLAAVAPGVPPLLARTIDRAIARDATARYRTAEQFGAAVARSATDAWGAGWLERSGVVVHVGGVILTSLRQEAGRPDGFTVRLAESATGRHPPDLAE